MAIDFESFKAWIESDGEIPFDMYAQDPNEWAWLQEIIPGLVIASAGGMAPFQAEGLYYGHPFYYRDRHGWASFRVGALDGEAPYLGNEILYIAGVETEEFVGGEHFIRNLVNIIPNLKRSEFPYEFEGKKLNLFNDKSWGYSVSETEKEIRVGWGHTPEEAYPNIFTTSAYLMEHGASAEHQLKMVQDGEFSPIPVNKDERRYPAVDPEFVVILPKD